MKMTDIFRIVIAVGLLFVAGCTEPIDPIEPLPGDTGGLTAFSYEFGSYSGGYWNYRIFGQNEKVYFEGIGSNGVTLNARGEISGNTLSEIADIIEEYGINRWHGFDRSDPDVLDGYSFRIAAGYENGTLSAYGYMLYPPGYDEGHKALADYLAELAQSVPAHELTSDSNIARFGVTLDSRTSFRADTRISVSFGLYGFDRVEYSHGDTLIFVSFDDLPANVTTPDALAAMDVYNSYDKADYLWMFGSLHKNGSHLRLYGGVEYSADWDNVVRAVDELGP